VALGEKPTAATVAMIPPLFLPAELIVTHVDIVGPFCIANFGWLRRPGIIPSAIAKLLYVPQATIRAIDLDHLFPTKVNGER
jgi:hypothetical protein